MLLRAVMGKLAVCMLSPAVTAACYPLISATEAAVTLHRQNPVMHFFFFFLEFWFSLGMLVVGGNLHNLKVSLALFVAKEKQKKSLLLADI